MTLEGNNVTGDKNRKTDKPQENEPCLSCHLPVEGEELAWAREQQNHPGVLGVLHQKCYDKICEAEPDTPWTDPISGEVDFEAMQEDLGVSTGEEEWEDECF